MSFGIQIFDSALRDVTSGVVMEFVLDAITIDGPGSRSFNLGPGESLRVVKSLAYAEFRQGRPVLTGYTISGNTISWTTEWSAYGMAPFRDRLIITKVVRG